jgi:hypothetical protein
MCTFVCVLCGCVCCDGKPVECQPSYGDVHPLSFYIQALVMCLLWKATRRRLSVVQKYQDVKIIWAPGTNTKTQTITLVVHTFCVLVYICVWDFSVCGCVYWQPWPFWSELYATGEERNAQRSVYILNVLGFWVILIVFFFNNMKVLWILVYEDFVNIEIFMVQKCVSYSMLVLSLLVCTTAQSYEGVLISP